MNKKTTFFLMRGLLIALSSLLPFSRLIQGNVDRSSAFFSETFRTLLLVISLLILLVVVWLAMLANSSRHSSLEQKVLVKNWRIGFLVPLIMVISTVAYVNPHARFSGDRFPYLTPGARLIKLLLYRQIKEPLQPEIVILGSSRAFTLSPDYIKNETGQKVFNMSVEGGRVGDYNIQLNYMVKTKSVPDVLIVDMSPETLSADFLNSELQPIFLIPYMPMNQAGEVTKIFIQDVLGIQTLSDSFYLLFLPGVQSRLRTWSFEENGYGIRKPLTHEQYLSLLNSTIEQRKNSLQCRELNKLAQEQFRYFVASAQENAIGIVLYISPIHAEFRRISYQKDPEKFDGCIRILQEYLNLLAEEYPNVIVRNLLEYKTVTDLGEKGFYDAVHITPYASELVVDALLPDIEHALEWSYQRSK